MKVGIYMTDEKVIIENPVESNLIKTIQMIMDMEHIALVYIDENDTEMFSAGYIKEYSENELLMYYVDPFGYNNGVAVKCIRDIIKIEYGDKYSAKIQKLNSIRKTEVDFFDIGKGNLFSRILEHSIEKKKIVTIEILNSKVDDAVGYVTSIENHIVTLILIDNYGYKDGSMLINMNDITHIVCDSSQEEALNILATNFVQDIDE
jgi:hypothetical protein